ncbi:MAG: CHAP domain-containing protein [Ruminococcaceae bacterium]|nr:CHAP domain-containing protein [Oscillospiraceae bacterium]
MKNSKRILAAVICAVMLLTALPFNSFAAYENTHTNTGNQIEDIIAVATTQLGYKEGNSSSQLGGTTAGSGNYTKYGKWYGINPGAWCAMFVSWCANQAGISTSIIPKHASCDVGMNWFKNNGRWQYSKAFGGTYTPKRGDLIYFGNNPNNLNDSTHVAIVTGVDSSKVYTVEGNKSNICQNYSYSLTDDYIFGYGLPAYTSSGSTNTNYGTYIVTATSLNMRSTPSSSGTIVAVLKNGDAIVVTQISGNWAYTTFNGKSGWCSLNYLLAQDDIKYAISNDGIELIKGLEGFSQYAYWDVSQWSIGYGTGCAENEYPNGITEAQAETLLRSAIVKYELYLNEFLVEYNITLNQNQYDALVSFTYNLGNIWGTDFTLRTYLINGINNYTDDQIKAAFGEKVSAGGQVLEGLVARRNKEAEFFLAGGGTSETVSAKYVTNTAWLAMREGPGSSYTQITSLPKGAELNVTQIYNNWGYATYGSYAGWVSLNYCDLVNNTGKDYTITFDANGGTLIGEAVYGINNGDYYKDIFTELPAATREGYTLEGWYCAEYDYTLSLADSEYYAVNESVTFVAVWTKNITYTVNTAWLTMREGPGSEYTSIGSLPRNAVITVTEYSGKWGKTTYDGVTGWVSLNLCVPSDGSKLWAVILDTNGGIMDAEITYPINTGDYIKDVFTIPTPVKDGYDFTGWYNEVYSLTLNGELRYEYTEDLTFMAQWTKSSVHEHVYTPSITKEATCTANGVITYTCSCGSSYTESIPATGHNYNAVVTNPNCTANGYTTYTCVACGDSYTSDSVPALGHNYDSAVTKPTCTDKGYTVFTCTVCGHSYKGNESAALGHSFGAWYTSVEPTVATKGEERRDCSVCGVYETNELPMLENTDTVPNVTTNGSYDVMVSCASDISYIRYAKGEYSTSSAIKNAADCVTLNASKIASFTVNNICTITMADGGLYSLWIKTKDGTEYIKTADISVMDQKVESYGVSVTVKNLYGVKDYFICPGDYDNYSDIKANYLVLVTANKINGAHDYTYIVPNPGLYTIYIRYEDSSRPATILKTNCVVKEPEFNGNGLQFNLSNLEDVKVIRTAYGTYKTPGEIKRAEGQRSFSGKTIGSDYTIQYRENGTVTVAVVYNHGYEVIYTYEVQQKVPSFVQNGNTVTFGQLDGLNLIRYAKGTYTTSQQIKLAADSKAIKANAVVDGFITLTLEPGTYTFCVQYLDESYNYYVVTAK